MAFFSLTKLSDWLKGRQQGITRNYKKHLSRKLPVTDWLPNYNLNFAISDLIAGLTVGLNNLGGWVLDSFLGVTHTGSVRVMKRSEERLYTNSVKQLRELVEAEINLSARPSVWHKLV